MRGRERELRAVRERLGKQAREKKWDSELLEEYEKKIWDFAGGLRQREEQAQAEKEEGDRPAEENQKKKGNPADFASLGRRERVFEAFPGMVAMNLISFH